MVRRKSVDCGHGSTRDSAATQHVHSARSIEALPSRVGRALMDLHSPQPNVLIASLDRLMSRSLETVFEQHGFVVVRTESGARALNLARRTEHDAVVLVEGLQDLPAVEVCRALRDDPLFDSATPIIITSASPITHESRLAAYGAGAWEYCSQPLDLDTLFLKLGTFLRARKDLELAQSKCLMD